MHQHVKVKTISVHSYSYNTDNVRYSFCIIYRVCQELGPSLMFANKDTEPKNFLAGYPGHNPWHTRYKCGKNIEHENGRILEIWI